MLLALLLRRRMGYVASDFLVASRPGIIVYSLHGALCTRMGCCGGRKPAKTNFTDSPASQRLRVGKTCVEGYRFVVFCRPNEHLKWVEEVGARLRRSSSLGRCAGFRWPLRENAERRSGVHERAGRRLDFSILSRPRNPLFSKRPFWNGV